MKQKGPPLVYFIKPVGMEGPIKIGFSFVPANRVIDLAAWSPWPLELMGTVPGTGKDERFLHACFHQSHSHREWFHGTLALQQAIKRILAAGSIEAVRETLPAPGTIPRKPRTPWTEDRKLIRSYDHRISKTSRSLRIKLGDESAPWYRPLDVRQIMDRWQGSGRRAPITPTAAEIERLEEYLADPEKHSVVPHWKARKDSICVAVFLGDEEIAA